MEKLNAAERELVALGAALGSNCVPCIEYHIPESRKAGLNDQQISEAIRLADKVRQVPARKVFARALELVSEAQAGAEAGRHEAGCTEPGSRPQAEQPCCA